MPSARHILAAVAALATLAACDARITPAPDFAVHGVGVVVRTDAPFAHRADFPARVESTVSAALAYWGGTWSDLAGSTLTLVDAPTVACGGTAALGCWDGDLRVTTRDPGLGTFACVEETVLVHEVGHAVLGDRLHEDPRWMELEPVAAMLANRVGYTADGDVPCELYLSVWRHLLGSP